MSGHGGWPMTVFLDPEGVPFYGGTYFPPDESRGMPSFRMVMEAVVDAFERQREEIRERAPRDPRAARRDRRGRARAGAARGRRCSSRRSSALRGRADRERGGFGGAPKFPPASALELLLARGETEVGRGDPRRDGWPAASTTSSAAASPATRSTPSGSSPTSRRCSTTTPCSPAPTCTAGRRSATSATAASARRRSTGCCARCAAPRAASTRRSTPTPRARRAASTSGRRTQIREVLGDGAEAGRSSSTGSPRRGNFEGAQHPPPRRRAPTRREPAGARRGAPGPLRGARQARLAGARRQAPHLLERAGDRRPGRGRRGARPRRTTSTPPARCAEFVLDALRDADGRLLRTYKDGDARLNAYLEDHAFLLEALLTLYEATFEQRWFERGPGARRRR